MTLAPHYELYRVILDYEALQDGFADRIDDLDTTMAQIDMAGGLLDGYTQKLLSKTPAARGTDRHAKQRRTFAWDSLGKMLKGTGLALVLVVDDERFAPLKERLAKRARPRKPPNGSIRRPAWLFTRSKSLKMQVLRNQSLSPKQRKKIARKAARARWRKPRVATVSLPAATASPAPHPDSV